VSNGRDLYRVPALGGRNHARYLMRRIAATTRVESSGGPDLAAMLDSMRRPPRRRGLVAVVSDFLDAGPAEAAPRWERPLRALSDRHQLLGIEVLDPRELELPAAGLITFVDPESGRELEVQTNSASVRRDYAAAALVQRQRIAAALRHAGAGHLQLRTDRDWINDVVRFVIARRRFAGPSTAISAQGIR
jgi:uncharacterized protein (DUF58 family)